MSSLFTFPLQGIAFLGRYFLSFLHNLGHLSLFAFQGLKGGFSRPFYFRAFRRQLFEIGYNSLPVVGLTAIFTGAVLALQVYTGATRFNPSADIVVPQVVVVSLIQELAPVLAGLMIAGRIGASMAAELGTMRVTEQIDALVTLSVNPFQYLIAPRLFAAIIALPFLVILGDIIGILGGFLISTSKLGFHPEVYLKATVTFARGFDFLISSVKAGVFGFLVALMGCYHGFYSRGGAQGVGRATTNAVVSSSILILFFNFFITGAFFTQ